MKTLAKIIIRICPIVPRTSKRSAAEWNDLKGQKHIA